jgi:hypothetical protein
MTEKSNPGALVGAAGAQEPVKAISADRLENSINVSLMKARLPNGAAFDRLRAVHLVRYLGVSDHAAAMLAALAFAGVAR